MNQAEQCSANVEVIWRFVRGDMETAEFEQWVYANSSLEAELGADFYLDVISVDYSKTRPVDDIQLRLAVLERELSADHYLDVISVDYSKTQTVGDILLRLAAYAKINTIRHCECLTMGDIYRTSLFHDQNDVFRPFEKLAQRGEPYWWIFAYKCIACRQGWLVAFDPDEYYPDEDEYEFLLKRLSPEEIEEIIKDHRWPSDFDDFEIIRTGWRAPDPSTAAYPDLQSFEDLATLSAGEMRAVMDALFIAGEDGVPSIAATPGGDRAHAIAAAFSGASEQVRDAMTDVLTEAEARCLREDITAGRPPPDMVLAAQAAILEVARQPDRYTPPKRFEPSESQIREAKEHQDAILKGLGDILKD